MRSIPFIMKGAFRCALRTALEEVISGIERHCDIRIIRGWELFLLLPRLLLYRPSRGGHVPRKQLEARMQQFQFGSWVGLLDDSQSCNAVVCQETEERPGNRCGKTRRAGFVFG